MLTGHSGEEIDEYCYRSNLDKTCIVRRFVPHAMIPDHMGLADFAITPIKPIASKKYSTPVKNGEYWALGLPVVITPGISDDSAIIEKHRIGALLNELSGPGYLKAVKEIDAILSGNTREELYDKIRAVAVKYRNFSIAEDIYRKIYSPGAD